MILEISNLKKHFDGVKAVDKASFSVKPGTITALIGPNGAGKSTVFNLVSGLLKPDSGSILFNDQDITGKRPDQISNLGISRSFQQSRLFNNLSAMDNLLLVLDNKDSRPIMNLLGKNQDTQEKLDKVRGVLGLVSLEKQDNKLARDLSFGQKRLLELARSMLNPHDLMLLDEPVAGVNPRLRTQIAKILKTLRKQGETILLIEHDMNFTLSLADHVVVMQKGKVIAEGKPASIRRNRKVLEAYLGE
jgi:ABC-type branched-subunit amino acid transport system ATPase component